MMDILDAIIRNIKKILPLDDYIAEMQMFRTRLEGINCKDHRNLDREPKIASIPGREDVRNSLLTCSILSAPSPCR